ncbi:MAG: hypothetical protein ACT4PM_02480 [Gemmatimonadales bacterium]
MVTKRERRSGRRARPSRLETSRRQTKGGLDGLVERPPLSRLRAYLATDPISDMYDGHEELQEAVTLIKHCGATDAELAAKAQEMVLDAAVEIAREYRYLEPTLVKIVNLLDSHLLSLGLEPFEGRWVSKAEFEALVEKRLAARAEAAR